MVLDPKTARDVELMRRGRPMNPEREDRTMQCLIDAGLAWSLDHDIAVLADEMVIAGRVEVR